MTAQLILQFPMGDDLDSYDKLICFEEWLISFLGASAKVDGHDCGSGEMNIFILTSDPTETFALIQQADHSLRPSQEMSAAYRLMDGEDYVCLWPPELSQFNIA